MPQWWWSFSGRFSFDRVKVDLSWLAAIFHKTFQIGGMLNFSNIWESLIKQKLAVQDIIRSQDKHVLITEIPRLIPALMVNCYQIFLIWTLSLFMVSIRIKPILLNNRRMWSSKECLERRIFLQFVAMKGFEFCAFVKSTSRTSCVTGRDRSGSRDWIHLLAKADQQTGSPILQANISHVLILVLSSKYE